MVSKTFLHFLDFVKDVQFIVLFNEKREGRQELSKSNLLNVLFALALGFLVASEVVKIVQLASVKGSANAQWLTRIILSPLQVLPIWMNHKEHRLEYRQWKLVTITRLSTRQQQLLAKTTKELEDIKRMKGELRSTENVLEHFFQFILTLLLTLSSASGSIIEVIDLSQSEVYFSIFSSIVSLFSMVMTSSNARMVSARL